MRFIAPLLLGLALLTSDLRAQQLTGDLLPMLDTGGHTLPIVGLSFTPDGRQLVSASNDKTIRVWDLATGKPVRTIRGESAPGIQGRIYAMALSPDGKWLAVGGWTFGSRLLNEFGIRLYDFGSGRLVARLETDKFLAFNLAFSPDSRYLISGNATNASVFASIWDVEQRQRKHNPFSNTSAVGFMPDGARAVTNGSKGPIVWRVSDGSEILRGEGHSASVVRLAVAPDGTIASGDESGEIRLWDSGSMYNRRGETIGVPGRVLARQGSSTGNLSFSPDGKALLACVAGVPDGLGCRIYDVASGQAIVTYSGHDYAVTATAISADGRWAATAGDSNNEIHLWDLLTGQPRLRPDGQPLKLVGQGRSVLAVGFSADGQQISWGYGGACSQQSSCPDARDLLQYAMTLPSAQNPLPRAHALDRAAAEAFQRASKTHGEWSLEISKGGYRLDVKQSGQTTVSIPSAPGLGILTFKHAAVSFSADGETIISGRSGDGMMAYDRQGKNYDRQSKRLGKFIGHEGEVSALAYSPDGRILLSGSTDQTLRLWNPNTRELLVSVFHGKGGEWVMWMPQGYYAASGPGTELMGWQINRGPEREAEYLTAIQFRKALNRPDIIARAIQLASAEEAAKEAQDGNLRLADLLARPLPRLRIASPKPNAVLAGGSVNLEILLEATRAPVKLIRIQVNGQQIAEHQPEQGGGFAPGALNFTVPLVKGRNAIRVIGIGESGETTDDIVATHDGDGDLDKRGTLYVLAIGVDKYPNLPGSDLRFSGADAMAFAAAMKQHVGSQHERVVSRVLVNGAGAGDVPTATNILNALGMLRQTRETDTVVVFVAGHGVNEGPNYRFLPTDAAKQSAGGFLSASVIPWYAFQEAIESAKGRRILFLDTCHAGNSYNQRLSSDSYETNVIVYSAARWDQEALERPDLGHGLFTYAIVEGIGGKAAKRDSAAPITTMGLRDFLVARVAELASKLGHQQEPQYFRGRDAIDYVLVGAR
jgi:WD40 repeat protein